MKRYVDWAFNNGTGRQISCLLDLPFCLVTNLSKLYFRLTMTSAALPNDRAGHRGN